MMEEELRQILKEQGWNLFKRKRGTKEYFYAQRWKKGEVYITSVTNLPNLTREKVLAKVANL